MTKHYSTTTLLHKPISVALLLCAPFLFTACDGGGSSTSSYTTDGSTTESTIRGTATKGPIDAATITVFALNADGTRGEYLGSTTTDSTGSYSVEIDYEGAVSIVATDGTYVDEASGQSVVMTEGDELETLLASAASTGNVAVTALTTIAASRAKANASTGLSTAIASANTEVATAFGLSGVDISATVPADLTRSESAQASAQAKSYGLVQASLTQVAEDAQLSAEVVLTMIRQMAEDFSDGAFDGTNNSGAAIDFSLSVTPQQAHARLELAMSAFLTSPQNQSGMGASDITIPEADASVSGQASKGPIANATVLVYRLNEDGSRGELLATTRSDEVGFYSVSVDASGPVAVVARGGSYRDEATGDTVTMGENELETLIPDVSESGAVAVTALTTVAAKRAAANAEAGLATAIQSANAEVAALFELEGVDISSTLPSDLTRSDSSEDSAAAQSYGLAQAGLTQLAEVRAMAPEEVLALVSGIAADFSDGVLDGVRANGEAVDTALGLTPAEAVSGLETAKRAFLNSAENASDLSDLPIPVNRM